MRSFIQKLEKLAGRLKSNRAVTPQVQVTAFGKHPGWPEHIQAADIPLGSAELESFKELVYLKAINQQIDNGGWRKLEAEGTDIPFGHLLLRQSDRSTIVCRIWPSRDRVGRSQYPMLACAHYLGVPPLRCLEMAEPVLRDVERKCQSTNDAAAVIQAVRDAAAALAKMLETAAPPPPAAAAAEPAPPSSSAAPSRAEALNVKESSGTVCHAAIRRIVGCERMGRDAEKLRHVLFELVEYLDLDQGKKSRFETLRRHAIHVRVPACAAGPADSVRIWSAFVGALLSGDTPSMVVAPDEKPWADVLVAEPSPLQFHCLRASDQVKPLTTDSPGDFEFELHFLKRALQFLVRSGAPELEKSDFWQRHHSDASTA